MEKITLQTAQENLYNSDIKHLDKHLKKLLKIEKEVALAKRIDDELER